MNGKFRVAERLTFIESAEQLAEGLWADGKSESLNAKLAGAAVQVGGSSRRTEEHDLDSRFLESGETFLVALPVIAVDHDLVAVYSRAGFGRSFAAMGINRLVTV